MTDNVFTYNDKVASDTMQNTPKMLVKHIGTLYGQDISNYIGNRTVLTIVKPKHSRAVLLAHAAKETLSTENYNKLLFLRQAQESLPQQSATNNPEIAMKLAELQNDMALQAAAHTLPMEIKLYGDEETEHRGKWRTYRDRNSRLDKNRGQVFSIIMGQCMQQLLDKINQDTYWTTVSTSYDPLSLLDLIEKTVMSQYQDTYPCSTVY